MLKEIEDWKDDMESKESILYRKSNPSRIMPPVRKSNNKLRDQKKESENKSERIKGSDYKSWENYDADKECLRLELEEERRADERCKEEKEKERIEMEKSKMSLEEVCISEIKDYVSTLSNEEREMMSLKEKDIGNEFYKTHHLDDAVKHYTRSIYMSPNINNLNNRAMTYLKQCKFSKALIDLNEVIKMDSDNVKARYRRATALQHKCEFQKALDDIRVVLKKEPNHVMARYFADRLREDCSTLPKKHRLRIRDETGATRIVEVTEEEMLTKYKDKDFVEINDFGFPKIMCNCNGKYVDDPGIRHEDNVRFQHLRQRKHYEDMGEQLPAYHHATNQPIIQALNAPDMKPTLPGGGRRLEIVELDSINEESEDSVQPSAAVTTWNVRKGKEKKTSENLSISQQVANTAVATDGNDHTVANNLELLTTTEDSIETARLAWIRSVNEICTKNEAEAVYQNGKTQETDVLNDNLDNLTPFLADDEEEIPPPKFKEIEVMEDENNDDDEDDFGETIEKKPEDSLEDGDCVDNKPITRDSSKDQWLKHSVISVNSDFEKCIDLNGSQNFKLSSGEAPNLILSQTEDCQCSLKILKPLNYLEKWNQIQSDLSNDDKIKCKAALLKCICPLHIPEVFSLNVNETILTDIINCLCYFFGENYNNEIILDYARAVIKIQRFNITILFVATDVKEKLLNMFVKMGPNADDVRKAFFR